jgi:hypothetical protein
MKPKKVPKPKSDPRWWKGKFLTGPLAERAKKPAQILWAVVKKGKIVTMKSSDVFGDDCVEARVFLHRKDAERRVYDDVAPGDGVMRIEVW